MDQEQKAARAVPPFDFVVFGGGGDLALRKLIPSLFYRHRDGRLPDEGHIVGLGRHPLSRDEYLTRVEEACRRYIPAADFTAEAWAGFRERLDYVPVDATDVATFQGLSARLAGHEGRVRVFYLSVSPELYGPICQNLGAAGLVTPLARVVLEKPLGHDLASSRAINDLVGSIFQESQIFRIDHYLGKETVQNLMVLRFGNSLFEPLWRSSHIDHVQITVAETVGLEGRTSYYDKAGALCDMVQNHMLQLLCLVAMEPPTRFEQDAVRDEKLKVLRALRPFEPDDIGTSTVRAQYRRGAVGGAPVAGYLDELGAGARSRTETFVALRASVDNWRWAGVPFYLRTGKRMPARGSHIVIQFRAVPHVIFPEEAGALTPNRLVIRLQPNEGVHLEMMNKVPGGMRMRSAPLNLSFADAFQTRSPDAYERLLFDVVRGDSALVLRRDEVDAAWQWVEPIRRGWDELDGPMPTYAAGVPGPTAAIALIERDGRTWHDEGE